MRLQADIQGKSGRATWRLALGVFAALVACAMICAFSLHAAPAAYGSMLTAANLSAGTPASSPETAATGAKTPRTTAEAGLRWSVKFDNDYVSPELIVGDEVIVTSGRGSNGKISKLNKKTGEIIAESAMHGGSAYSLIPPVYADGAVYVTLSDGSMEAFDLKTLKSLWFFKNKSGGQGNCPIVYSDGRVYTGYWSSETAERSFVCVNAKTGKLVWERANAGGYYWAGACVVGDYLLFGCDDGKSASETGTSHVRCVNKATGKDVSNVAVTGDQRSGIVYDADSGRIFFTSKPGYLYSAKFDAGSGSLSNLRSVKIGLETTATPAVYGGRVYVGASSGGFAKGTLSVVDTASLKLLYQLDSSSGIGGAVKSTPLVSTAYEDVQAGGDGKLYLYLTVNNPPGGITMVAVDPHSTKASQAHVVDLFTPPASMQQYCIASVVCDDEGNLYYRNDSNHLMSVGPGGTDPADVEDPSNGGSNGGSNNGSNGGGNSSGSKGEGGNSSSGNNGSQGGNTSGEPSGGEDDSTRRSGPIQGGGAPEDSNGVSTRMGGPAAGGVADPAARAAAGPASNAATGSPAQNGSARQTDAVAATGRLDETPSQALPGWLVPAIVVIAAAVALGAVFAVRTVSARKVTDDFVSEGSDEPSGR